jgi:hypothetical protein
MESYETLLGEKQSEDYILHTSIAAFDEEQEERGNTGAGGVNKGGSWSHSRFFGARARARSALSLSLSLSLSSLFMIRREKDSPRVEKKSQTDVHDIRDYAC